MRIESRVLSVPVYAFDYSRNDMDAAIWWNAQILGAASSPIDAVKDALREVSIWIPFHTIISQRR